MALNFQLSYLNNQEYRDIFPKVSFGSVVDSKAQQAFVTETLTVMIPPTNDITQTVAISTNELMANSYFEMHLNGTTEQDMVAYDTITQIEVKPNQLVLTRLYRKPTSPIEVTLVFYEVKGAL